MRVLKTLLVLLFVTCYAGAYAQCVDSTIFPVDHPNCLPDFEPVCGCDGETYHNWCYAKLKGGLFNNAWQDGPCGTLATHHYPNPYTGQGLFYLEVINKYEDDINVEIKDMNGMLYLSDHYSGLTALQTPYNFSGFPRGLYFIFIYNSSEFEVRKLMVMPP